MVSIIDDKYSTASRFGEDSDSLVILDPETGAVVESFPATGLSLSSLGGLAYWGGTLYGFSTNGNAYSFDPTTGEATGIIVNGAPSTSRTKERR